MTEELQALPLSLSLVVLCPEPPKKASFTFQPRKKDGTPSFTAINVSPASDKTVAGQSCSSLELCDTVDDIDPALPIVTNIP